MKITIIGAGMAGLLAANMLRRHVPTIKEQQKELPNNHTALLRFRSLSVSDATGIPFSRVQVRKGIWDGEKVVAQPTIPLANQYSMKVTEEIYPRSVWSLEPETRYLAPANFIEQMSACLKIEFQAPFSFIDHNFGSPSSLAISTVPMPMMMRATNYEGIPEFHYQPIFTLRVKILAPTCDVYQTIYNAAIGDPWYRATVHRNELIVESMNDMAGYGADFAAGILYDCFGFPTNVKLGEVETAGQKYGKISPISEEVRRHFILWLTERYHIYSLGRFATWRSLLLDDLVKDIKQIEDMITSASPYLRKLQTTKTNR